MRLGLATGSRSEWGLLYPLVKRLAKESWCNLTIYITGGHLSPEFGKTYRQVITQVPDGVAWQLVECVLSSDTGVGVAKGVGLAIIGFADAFQGNRPDLVLVLGDRFETMAAAQAAYEMEIPIGHISGGEVTSGSLDDSRRHAITQLATYHFTKTERATMAIGQMLQGRNEYQKIWTVGSLGVETLPEPRHPKQNQAVLLYHPCRDDPKQLDIVLEALLSYKGFVLAVGTHPDAGGRYINECLELFCINHHDASFVDSLSRGAFIDALNRSEFIIGNSSSGIEEAPSLRVPTVNIGSRQAGRECGPSVAHCTPANALDVTSGINIALGLDDFKSPYQGGASKRIVEVLRENLS